MGQARLIERIIPNERRERLIYAIPTSSFNVPEGQTLVPNVSGTAKGIEANFHPDSPVALRWTKPVAVCALVIGPSLWPCYPTTIEVDAVEAML